MRCFLVRVLVVLAAVTTLAAAGSGMAMAMAEAGPTAPPVIESLTPDHGDGGTVVTATGSGFVPGATQVAVNHVVGTVAGPVTVDPTGTTATFAVPGDRESYFFGGQVRLSLVTPAGESNQVSFTYLAHPVSYSTLHPNSGPARGGTTVQVALTGYMDPSAGLDVAGAVVGGIRVTSPVTLVPTGYTNGQPTTWVFTFVTPPHAPGTVSVTLISYVTLTGPPLAFTYLAPSQSTPTQPTSEPQLPSTGPSQPAGRLGLALLLAGLAMVAVTRRRSRG
jgi:hypothetical protein